MDVKLFLILFTAYICGSYKNQRNLPAPFQGNLAFALDGYKKSPDYVRPYYMEQYGYIGGPHSRNVANRGEGTIVINYICTMNTSNPACV